MRFTLSAVLLSLTALTSAIAIEEPSMAAHRREILDLEARQAKAVTTGACCTAGVSKKEDVCTTAAGAAGKCVPASSAGCNAVRFVWFITTCLCSFGFLPLTERNLLGPHLHCQHGSYLQCQRPGERKAYLQAYCWKLKWHTCLPILRY